MGPIKSQKPEKPYLGPKITSGYHILIKLTKHGQCYLLRIAILILHYMEELEVGIYYIIGAFEELLQPSLGLFHVMQAQKFTNYK